MTYERAKRELGGVLRDIKKTIGREEELRRLADEQFFDKTHDDKLHHYYYNPTKSVRLQFTNLTLKERYIFVLFKSTMFTQKEIAALCGMTRAGCYRAYERILLKLS